MKISHVLSAFALSMIVAGTAFAGASGKVDSVENEGRAVTIGGKPAKRGDVKAGMDCAADVDSGRAAMLTCK